MRNRFATTVDVSEGTAQETTRSLSRLLKLYEVSGVRYRAPLAVAILSVAFQEYPLWIQSSVKVFLYSEPILHLLGAGLLLASVLAALAFTSRLAIALFIAIAAIAILPDW